uniref:Uncharacterized protein n=1 Tax=Manihot esculenta TaxID=3983 RepID=A0A2C9UFI4_MANES
MANPRLAKFILEVAPPQYIRVMSRRASKILDTINEEERDIVSPINSLASPRSPTSSATTIAAIAVEAATAAS